jgi:hypothetical protein
MSDFVPVDPNAHDPLPYPELKQRVSDAMAKASEGHWNLLNSENYAKWTPDTVKKELAQVRRETIQQFNEEMANK